MLACNDTISMKFFLFCSLFLFFNWWRRYLSNRCNQKTMQQKKIRKYLPSLVVYCEVVKVSHTGYRVVFSCHQLFVAGCWGRCFLRKKSASRSSSAVVADVSRQTQSNDRPAQLMTRRKRIDKTQQRIPDTNKQMPTPPGRNGGKMRTGRFSLRSGFKSKTSIILGAGRLLLWAEIQISTVSCKRGAERNFRSMSCTKLMPLLCMRTCWESTLKRLTRRNS